jgi:hypothetical protein
VQDNDAQNSPEFFFSRQREFNHVFQEQVQRVMSLLQLPAMISANHPLPFCIDAVLPSRAALDLNDDVAAHEVGFGIGEAALFNHAGWFLMEIIRGSSH